MSQLTRTLGPPALSFCTTVPAPSQCTRIPRVDEVDAPPRGYASTRSTQTYLSRVSDLPDLPHLPCLPDLPLLPGLPLVRVLGIWLRLVLAEELFSERSDRFVFIAQIFTGGDQGRGRCDDNGDAV
jgi:hypothetical protein